MSNTAYIFDVDGTLTDPRQPMDPEFRIWFAGFCSVHDVYLVTGSDYEKTVEQVGETITHAARIVFNCNGNDVWTAGRNIRSSSWKLPEAAHEWLSNRLTESEYPVRKGQHFEHRPGNCNFSIVGRGASLEDRKDYLSWDNNAQERQVLVDSFNGLFPTLQASIGGEISIDICEKGSDKSQIIHDLLLFEHDDFLFFGDKITPGGNDYTLAQVIQRMGTVHQVSGWRNTFEILHDIHW